MAVVTRSQATRQPIMYLVATPRARSTRTRTNSKKNTSPGTPAPDQSQPLVPPAAEDAESNPASAVPSTPLKKSTNTTTPPKKGVLMFVEERKPDLGGVKYLTNLEVKIMCEEYTEEEEANAREAANVLVSLGFGSW